MVDFSFCYHALVTKIATITRLLTVSLKNVFEENDENKNRRKTQFMHHKEHYDPVFNSLLISA
jgi:hypothetical protein